MEKIIDPLYGGQDYEYNFHYQVFNFERLKSKLEQSGFYDVRRYDWKDFLPDGFDDFSPSYLPHMDFKHSRLMSLNVYAKKLISIAIRRKYELEKNIYPLII